MAKHLLRAFLLFFLDIKVSDLCVHFLIEADGRIWFQPAHDLALMEAVKAIPASL